MATTTRLVQSCACGAPLTGGVDTFGLPCEAAQCVSCWLAKSEDGYVTYKETTGGEIVNVWAGHYAENQPTPMKHFAPFPVVKTEKDS